VGVAIDVAVIIATWTVENATLNRIRELQDQIRQQLVSFNDIVQQLIFTLQQLLGPLFNMLNVIKQLLKLRRRKPEEPGKMDPGRCCLLLAEMKASLDVPFMIFVDEGEHSFKDAQIFKKDDIDSLLNHNATAQLIMSIFYRYPDAVEQQTDHEPDQAALLASIGSKHFRLACAFLPFGNGSSIDKRGGSWVAFWEFFFEQAMKLCLPRGCWIASQYSITPLLLLGVT